MESTWRPWLERVRTMKAMPCHGGIKLHPGALRRVVQELGLMHNNHNAALERSRTTSSSFEGSVRNKGERWFRCFLVRSFYAG